MPIDFVADTTEKDFGFVPEPEGAQPEPAFEDLKPPTFQTPFKLPPATPADIAATARQANPIGEGLDVAGRLSVGGAADIGKVFFRPLTDEFFPEQATPGTIPQPTENITAALDATQELPAKNLANLPPALQFTGHAAQGLVETAPKMAAVAGLHAAGVPSFIAAGGVFGTTPEGFDPKQAVIAAALPLVGKASGGVVGMVAKRLGVTNVNALNWMKGIAGTAGPAAAMLVDGERNISKLPPEQQDQARQQLWESLAGQAALGPMGVKFERQRLPFNVPRPEVAPAAEPAAESGGTAEPEKTTDRAPEPAPAEQADLGLSDEDYDAHERQAIEEAEKLGSTAEPVEQFTGETEDQPFAGQFMRPTGNGMQIRRANFRQWLSRIAPEQRANAITQRVLEEHIHNKVSNNDAGNYWNTLTALEKAIERRVYTGKWTAKGLMESRGDSFSDTQMGHEAMRRRMQRLMTGSSSEIAEAARKERWTVQSLDALGDLVRNVREEVGTKASRRGLELLSDLDDNLKTARAVVTGQQAPAAYDKETAEREGNRIADMDPAEFVKSTIGKGGPTGAGYDFAIQAGESGRGTLERLAKRQEVEATEMLDRLKGASKENMSKLFAEMSQRSSRKQFFDEGLRMLDAIKAVRGGMSPEDAAKEHGVDVSYVQRGAAAEAPAAYNKEGDEFLETERMPTGATAAKRIQQLESDAQQALASGDRGLSEMIHGEIERMKRAFPDWDQQAFPAAYQKELGLTPGKKGEEKPSAADLGAKPITPKGVADTGAEHISERIKAGTPPTLKDFTDKMQGTFGAMKPGALFETYTKTLYDELLKAPGSQIEKLAKKLGVRAARVADPATSEGFKLEKEGATDQAREEIRAATKTRQARERYRNNVIGKVADKLIGKAAEKAEPITRTTINPEDLRQTGEDQEPGFFDISNDDIKNPEVLAQRLTQDSRRKSSDPVSLTKRVTALVDKYSGKVYLVSTYPHGRSGAMLIDPSVSTIRAHRPLTSLLNRYRPVASMLLDEPVQNFRQKFESLGEFEQKLATDARTAAEHTFTEAPQTEGEFQPGPTTGRYATPGQFSRESGVLARVRPITDAEATAVFDHIESEVGTFDSPDDVKASLAALKETTARQALSGFRSLMRGLEERFPNDSTEELLNRLAQQIYENHTQSKTLQEFVSRTMAQGSSEAGKTPAGPPQPTNVQGAESRGGFPTYEPGIKRPPFKPLYRAPRPQPPPGGEMLDPAARMALKARQAQEGGYKPTTEGTSAALESRGVDISPYARGVRPGGVQGVGRFRKPIVPRGTPDTPAAYDKLKGAAKEQWDITVGDLKTVYSRRETKRNIPALLDGADNASGQMATIAQTAINNASTAPIDPSLKGGARSRAVAAEQAEGAMRRKAAVAYVSAGQTDNAGNWTANKSKLIDWRAKLDIAEAKARSWTTDANPLKRREGRKWMASVKEMQAAVDYAEDHWSDRTFVEGAQKYRQEIHDAIQFENENGADTVERENYIPGLFSGGYFAGKRLLGTQYRMPKKFQNPYDAIAAGPYYLASQDVGDLAHSRILAGRRSVERQLWTQTLAGITDPATRKPVAKQPIPVAKNTVGPDGETVKDYSWQSPSPDYELVYSRPGAKPIAVHNGYARLVKQLLRPSVIEDLPLGKEALAATGILKHGVILLWDSFHPARLSQYMAATAGVKGFGWRGGYSALSYRPEELPRAVERGYISQAAADWAMEPVEMNVPKRTRTSTGWTTTNEKVKLPRKAIADELVRQGLNAPKITDALYKDAVQNIPFLGEAYHKAISPYNKLLFDRFMPGIMMEAAVKNLERLNKSHPDIPLDKLARDVIRDVNVDFGNMGRQGIFKSKTFRDIAQLVMLAPMWQEGLITKELQTASRVAAIPARLAASAMGKELPYRKGLPTLGVTGRMMARGLGAYFIASQLINLITRKKFTWENEEEGHKLDAFMPIGDKGVWLSPLSVFAESTHDYIRLGETKPGVFDRMIQMVENRLGPVGKMANIMWTGNSPSGQKYATSAGRAAGAAAQVTPFSGASPISFAVPARALGHAVAPNVIAPNQPGALPKQLMASFAGVKVNTAQSTVNRLYSMADKFMEKEGLKKDTGWQQVMTDDPSYSELRREIRNGDVKAATKTYQALLKGHSDKDIVKAMKLWAKAPFTRSNSRNEHLFQQSLSDEELNAYTRANEERQGELDKFYDFLNQMP